MTELSTAVRVAQALGLTSSAVAAGGLLAASVMVIPTILEAPAGPLQVTQFARQYNQGVKMMPGLLVLGSVANAYLAWALPSARALYGLAAAAVFVTQPFTFTIIMPTNRALLGAKRHAEGKEGQPLAKEETPKHVAKWGKLNNVRVALTFVGTFLSAWATLF